MLDRFPPSLLRRSGRVLFALLPVLATLAVPSVAVHSAPAWPTFWVNSTLDGPATGLLTDGVCETAPTNDVCTLRAAIMKANHFPGGGVTINLPGGTYPITIAPAPSADETNGDFNITAPMTIMGAGPGSTIVDAGGLDRAIQIGSGVTVAISNLSIRNGNATAGYGPQSGGGIYNAGILSLSHVAISGGIAQYGGGIQNNTVLTLDGVQVSNSQVQYDGGGIRNSGSLTILNSTLSNNGADRNGGGLFNDLIAQLSSVTVAGNVANADGLSLGSGGGGIYNNAGRTLTLKNSLLAGNFIDIVGNECSGTIISQDYNVLKSPIFCVFTGATSHHLSGVDPLLNPPQDNGGGTLTRALSAGSPAIDWVPAPECSDGAGNPLIVDQRGHPRPLGSGCDAGAFEGAVQAPFLDINLIRNGDAETAAGSPSGAFVGVPNWSLGPGTFSAARYGLATGFPSSNDPSPPDRKANLFVGGASSPSRGSQSLDVSAAWALIDAGSLRFELAGYFGGLLARDDFATLTATFISAANAPLSVIQIGNVSAQDRAGATGLLPRRTAGAVPPGTRQVRLDLELTRVTAGAYNTGFADSLSLILSVNNGTLFVPRINR